jgi:isopenicillin N synthase-like dioxygenase
METQACNRFDFAPLLTIQYRKLLQPGPAADREASRLFDATRSVGFFYLDLRDPIQGSESTLLEESQILNDAERLFRLMKAFFDLHIEEKIKYDVSKCGGYFG